MTTRRREEAEEDGTTTTTTTEDGADGRRCGRRMTIRVCEFYCGVGVMHAALTRCARTPGRAFDVVGAFDINPNACDAYEKNWGARPSQKSLVSVPMKTLEKLEADAWVMSPPCQPFTRQGLKKDVDDGRAESFMRLVDEMAKMDPARRPKYVFVENVVGFETSKMREILVQALSEMAFHTQEFILTPSMFGVPYSRPRYFMCARSTQPFADAVDAIRRSPPRGELSHKREWIPGYEETRDADVDVAPLSRFMDPDDDDTSLWDAHAVKQEDVNRAMGTIDIVTAQDVTCNCFTKSYFKYVKGTGSVVANRPVDKSTWDGQMRAEDKDGVRLRYFTVKEVTRLHSLPDDFAWPDNLTLRQRYTLLGNSMSVACVAPLFDYLFSSASVEKL